MASLVTPFLQMSSGRKWSSQIKSSSPESSLCVSLRAASQTWAQPPELLQVSWTRSPHMLQGKLHHTSTQWFHDLQQSSNTYFNFYSICLPPHAPRISWFCSWTITSVHLMKPCSTLTSHQGPAHTRHEAWCFTCFWSFKPQRSQFYLQDRLQAVIPSESTLKVTMCHIDQTASGHSGMNWSESYSSKTKGRSVLWNRKQRSVIAAFSDPENKTDVVAVFNRASHGYLLYLWT